VAELRRRGHEIAWLDAITRSVGRDSHSPSFIAFSPRLVIEQRFDEQSANGLGDAALFDSVRNREIDRAPGVWALLERAIGCVTPTAPVAPGLGPGWIGYVGFEAAGQLERLPKPHRDDFGMPVARLALYERVILLDHVKKSA